MGVPVTQCSEAWMPEDYEDYGFFICQGKIPEEFANKIYQKRGAMEKEQWDELIKQVTRGQSHPDEEDIDNLYDFTLEVIEDIEYYDNKNCI